MSGGDSSEGFRNGYISWLCRTGIDIASGETPNYEPSELTIDGQELRFPGTTVARSSSETILSQLRSEFHRTLEADEFKAMASEISRLKGSLEGRIADLKRDLTDLLLIGAVTGRCSVCQRLGL